MSRSAAPSGRQPDADFASGASIRYSCKVAFAADRDVAQLGSALRSGRRGRRFKSCHPDQKAKRVFHSEGPLCFASGCSARRAALRSRRRCFPVSLGKKIAPGHGSRMSRSLYSLAGSRISLYIGSGQLPMKAGNAMGSGQLPIAWAACIGIGPVADRNCASQVDPRQLPDGTSRQHCGGRGGKCKCACQNGRCCDLLQH